jgi:hypothetical protein
MEAEMKYDIHATSSFKGYDVLLSGNTDPEGRADLNEGVQRHSGAIGSG